MAMNDDFSLANKRAKNLRAEIPKALAARYDRRIGRVVIRLSSGLDVAFSPHDAQGLENAKTSQLEEIEISPLALAFTFQNLTQTSTCQRCWRVFLVPGNGWRPDWAPLEAEPGARPREPLPRGMASWEAGLGKLWPKFDSWMGRKTGTTPLVGFVRGDIWGISPE